MSASYGRGGRGNYNKSSKGKSTNNLDESSAKKPNILSRLIDVLPTGDPVIQEKRRRRKSRPISHSSSSYTSAGTSTGTSRGQGSREYLASPTRDANGPGDDRPLPPIPNEELYEEEGEGEGNEEQEGEEEGEERDEDNWHDCDIIAADGSANIPIYEHGSGPSSEPVIPVTTTPPAGLEQGQGQEYPHSDSTDLPSYTESFAQPQLPLYTHHTHHPSHSYTPGKTGFDLVTVFLTAFAGLILLFATWEKAMLLLLLPIALASLKWLSESKVAPVSVAPR